MENPNVIVSCQIPVKQMITHHQDIFERLGNNLRQKIKEENIIIGNIEGLCFEISLRKQTKAEESTI